MLFFAQFCVIIGIKFTNHNWNLLIRHCYDSFVSQLNVTLTCDIIDMSVECIRDSGTNTERVGSLNLTSG